MLIGIELDERPRDGLLTRHVRHKILDLFNAKSTHQTIQRKDPATLASASDNIRSRGIIDARLIFRAPA